MLRKAFVGFGSVSLLCLAFVVHAQESPTPESERTPEPEVTPKPRTARVTFLPPPIDGTVSLGIYDLKGKLIRVLHRETDIDEFHIGADALWTTWDGKDDHGEDVPPGKYHARGFVVGDLGIDGIGFFFNDWVTADDAPRISRIHSLELRDDKLLLGVEMVSKGAEQVLYDPSSKTLTISNSEPRPVASPAPSENAAESIDPITAVPGREGTRWIIDRTSKGAATTELKQFSATGEFLRRLSSAADQPQPRAVAPSMTEDKVYLLEENDSIQRVRCLSLVATKVQDGKQPVSDWKVDFEKTIIVHRDFSIAGGKPVVSSRSANAPASIKVKLQPNPLLNDERVVVELAAGFDANGSSLKTIDGLPLRSISETAGLTRALLASRSTNGIDLFQDDGAVVEQFRVTGVDKMMSFDCGSFELK